MLDIAWHRPQFVAFRRCVTGLTTMLEAYPVGRGELLVEPRDFQPPQQILKSLYIIRSPDNFCQAVVLLRDHLTF
jgi:hypothetical protein